MVDLLRDKIADYVTKYACMEDWESVRETYGICSYIAFLCFSASRIVQVKSLDDVVQTSAKYGLEKEELLQELFKINDAEKLCKEIIKIADQNKDVDLAMLYQQYLSVDFIIKDHAFVFEGGKNGRDILGSYYTQNEFAEQITQKALDDFFHGENDRSEAIRIVDYSCGGAAFLLAAYKYCEERGVCAEILGYDVDPIAVVISRYKSIRSATNSKIKISVYLGNPLLECETAREVEKFKCAIIGRYYNNNMGVKLCSKDDVIIGNPPWEKIRFEEKKFLHHFFPGDKVSAKSDRERLLGTTSAVNLNFYKSLNNDYEDSKANIKKSSYFRNASCGELNTYALFTELSYRMLNDNGIAGLIIKSSLVKMPVYSEFFKKLTIDGNLYELYMFVNRRKIFCIDSREEFSVVYMSHTKRKNLSVALDLDAYNNFDKTNKLIISYQDLHLLNPDTGMMPNIKNNEELNFLLDVAHLHDTFGNVYPNCKFGRLVHLTSHSNHIKKEKICGYQEIYEGKFIEQYTSKYATFCGMTSTEKYKDKASAKPIRNPQGDEYPEARFFIEDKEWKNISKNFMEGYVIAWRSLTSATNRRTMIASILPLMPTCQSIQLLQLKEEKQMLHILALFNSVVFDYIVRLKMAGLDLTQTIIKQIPVPSIDSYEKIVEYHGVISSVSEHLISRLRMLYIDDKRVNKLFDKYKTYEVEASRKVIISDIDKLIADLYKINTITLKNIVKKFDKFYTNEEMENLF